jgi:hypothetical protein
MVMVPRSGANEATLMEAFMTVPNEAARAASSTLETAVSRVSISTLAPAPFVVAMVTVIVTEPALASSMMSDSWTRYCSASCTTSASCRVAKSSMEMSIDISLVTVCTCRVSIDWPTGMRTGLAPP